MAFSIKDSEVDKNLRFLASMTGESLTEAISVAVLERIEKVNLEHEKSKDSRRRKLQKFLAKRKTAGSTDNYNQKKITDELWGLDFLRN